MSGPPTEQAFRDATPLELGLSEYVARLEAALRVSEKEVYGRPEPYCRRIAETVVEALGAPS